MQTVLFGKNKTITKFIEENKKKIERDGKEVEVFTAKPKLMNKVEVTWEEMFRWDGSPVYNENIAAPIYGIIFKRMNISENEFVEIEESIFRADLNELHLHSDKVLKEETNDDCEDKYKRLVKEFNKQMIESNERLKERCDLYHLSYEDTDCEKLFKDVYDADKFYKIVDGKIVESEFNSLKPGSITLKTDDIFVNDHLKGDSITCTLPKSIITTAIDQHKVE